MKTILQKNNFSVRFAQEQDLKIMYDFIRELAEYEDLLDQVKATEESLFDALFKRKVAEGIIGEYQNAPVAFALFFHNFSSFSSQTGIFIEDLYVKPHMRRKGFGKIMFSALGKIAKERSCEKLEWQCLDWNEPSIQFYKSLGAKPKADWTVYRLGEKEMGALSDEME